MSFSLLLAIMEALLDGGGGYEIQPKVISGGGLETHEGWKQQKQATK